MPRVFRQLILLMLIVCPSAIDARAQTSQHDDANRLIREAARIWREVYASWGDEMLYLDGNPEMYDPAIAAREYARLQPAVELLRRSMKLGGPHYGPMTKPWLGGPIPSDVPDMQHAAKAAMADMRWRIHSRQAVDLGERAALLFDFARAESADGEVLHSLLGMAIGGASLNILREQAIPSGSLTSEQAKLALAALERTITDDPLQFSSSLARTADRDLAWITEQNADPAARETMLAKMAETATKLGRMELAAQFSDMSPGEIEAAAQQHAALLGRMSAITAMGDLDAAKLAWAQLEKERESGMYGPFAEIMADDANLIAIIENWEQTVAEVRDDLETIVRDPNGAERLMNAAYFYQRAIGAWQRQPGAFRQQLLDAANDAAMVPPDEWRERLSGVLADLDRAAMIDRCEFQPIERRQMQTNWQWPAEVVPLGELAALRQYSMREAPKTGDPNSPDLLQRDALGLIAMVDHLAQEGVIEFTMTAADMLEALAKAERWPEYDGVPDELTARLGALREQMERDDPLRLARTARLLPTLTIGPLLRFPDRSATAENLLRIESYRSRLPFIAFTHGLGTDLLVRDARALRSEAVEPALRAARDRLERVSVELVETESAEEFTAAHERFETAMTAEDRPALAEWSRCWTLPLFDLFERREAIREHARLVAERTK